MTSGGRWLPFEHLLIVDRHLLRVQAGEIKRLLIEMPIRHGKSELVSRYTPAWWLGRNPEDQIILASYEATFAESWGAKARDILTEFGPVIFGERVAAMPSAARRWMLEGHEGVMNTAGIRGSITGKGADVLIIDDPVKNAEEAASEEIRSKIWDAWQATLSSRLQPGGRVIVVMARWHQDDLAGRLQKEEPGVWTVLRLPAVAEAEDAMGREVGAALCPELYDEEALRGIQQTMGPYWFSALLQQKPTPAEGLLFKRAHFRYWTMEGTFFVLHDGEGVTRRYDSAHCRRFQTTDAAASDKTTADFSVVSTWAVTEEHDLLLMHTVRQQFDNLEVGNFFERENDSQDRPLQWIETFGAGKTPYKQLVKDGYPVAELKPEQGTHNDKIARAMAAIAAVENHKVFFPGVRPPWLDDWEEEHTSFPNGTNDDQVDTLSYAVRLLPGMGGTAPRRGRPEEGARRKPIMAGVTDMRF